jgi:hypothetical protein
MFLPHISDNNFNRVDIGSSEPLLLVYETSLAKFNRLN